MGIAIAAALTLLAPASAISLTDLTFTVDLNATLLPFPCAPSRRSRLLPLTPSLNFRIASSRAAAQTD
jgi:hypothetical protein